MDKQALIEERVALHEKSKALLEKAETEKRDLTKDEQQEFDRMHGRIEECRQALERIVQTEEEERNLERLRQSRGRKTDDRLDADNRDADLSLAFRAWALGGGATSKHITPDMRAACERLDFNWRDSALEARSLNSVTATQGQAAIPDEMMRSLIDVQKWFGSVRSGATVIPTATGAPLPVPKGDDTSNTGEIVADSGPVTTTADPTFNQVVLGSYKFSSKAVLVSVELLRDAAINMATYLGRKLGQRIGRIQNTKFTVGTGTNEPNGIVVASTLGKTAAATNTFTFDEIIDLKHSVDVAYRAVASFVMHDTIAAFVRKLKDSQGRYLWEVSTIAGQPDRLDGYPVMINNDMASALTTGQKLMLFGDVSAYHIRDAGEVEAIRADELFVLNHQVAFLAFQRSDGNLPDTTAVKHLKLL